MERAPGPKDGPAGQGAAGAEPPPAKPNLWILVGMTALALVIAVLVLVATTF